MNVAILGCGLIASRWVRTLARDSRITIAALADPDAEAAARLAHRYQLTVPRLPGWRPALEIADLDAVVNLTPPARHAVVSAAALDAGLHVLTEKPLALSLREATDLVHRAQTADRHLLVMQNQAMDPRFLAFRDLVRSGSGPWTITASTLVALHRPGFRARSRRPVLTDLAVHAFDQVRQLVTTAPLDIHATEVPLPHQGAHCGLATVLIRFADGSLFSYLGGYTSGGMRTPAGGRWSADGMALASTWDGEDHLTHSTVGEPTVDPQPIPVTAAPGYQLVIQSMVDMLHGEPYPELTAEQNLGSIALLDAALASAAKSRPRPVPCMLQEASNAPR
ncbi:Gfo/Idh/MocA family protein [Streptomyces fulvoviolaceus]|uniref:Gfo/Idh/MocA family protein n=1 Tax=Streptomyces fulvoviolaceus TaxID=285535 RepID=UPI0021C015DB|nr:Gfo/Idh/MocA family oxidoreductase [Streptomyces fulvoviolaceus]MCT9080446.1 Gfo/Idh/MocA family oxidoreductase [Streptomyces fulvoviolaceus]